MKFLVCSDTHINGADDEKVQRLKNTLAYAYEVAGELNAVMFCGDLVNNGNVEQFDAFESAVKSSLKGDTKLLAIVARNHDSWSEEGKNSLNRCRKITGEEPDFHVVIKGIHLIGISTSKVKQERYGLYQYSWLKKALKEADKDGKPVFVFQHEHVRNTVYGSSSFDGWGVNYFRKLYNKYPKLVNFSGHSHYPLNDPRSIWQGEFTAVGTGSMSYTEFTVDRDRKLHPEDNGISAQAWIVNVDDDIIELTGIDGISNSILCKRILDEPDKFQYDKMKDKSTAPVFDNDAKLTAEKADGKVLITCPEAKSTDGEIVFLYRAEINGESTYKINNYWNNAEHKPVVFELDAKPGETVKVWAENAYGKRSDTLQITI